MLGSYDRFRDLILWLDDWFKGERITFLVAEAENNIAEFNGTVADLFAMQARGKIGIFYHQDPDLENYRKRGARLFQHFSEAGFAEAADTQYLFLFGPLRIFEEKDAGKWKYLRFTSEELRQTTPSP